MQLFKILKGNQPSCNMSNGEGYLRFVVSLAILIFGASINSYLFMMLGIMIASTAIFRHCFIYDIFNLNKKITLEALYLRNLPKYNPEPIFILDHEGVATFKNTPAKNTSQLRILKTF